MSKNCWCEDCECCDNPDNLERIMAYGDPADECKVCGEWWTV